MVRIGLLSDTHGCYDPRFAQHFAQCDEIWHAGDIGTPEVADRLEEIGRLRAVFGNIDDRVLRRRFPETLRFRCEETEVLIKHIGGYPGAYDRSVIGMLRQNPPHLFISGHSHILKIVRDPSLGLLHINPGAAGRHGWHAVRTLVRFSIDGAKIKDVEIIELA